MSKSESKSVIPFFVVDEVESKPEKLPALNAFEEIKKKIKNETVESAGFHTNPLVSVTHRHGFIQTVADAFDKHYPLSIAPSHIWLLIMQGVAKHIELNAERLRYTFVSHKGKEKIDVRRDDFVKGSPTNDWANVFPEFSEKIKEKMNQDYHKLFTDSFSTTTPVEQSAIEITLMDAMKSYFEYSCYTLCGFPKIYLEGTPEDWEQLYFRVLKLNGIDNDKHFHLWVSKLNELTIQFMNASLGKPDIPFWRSFFKLGGGSGGPFISGWINTFFPYIESGGQWIPHAGIDWDNTVYSMSVTFNDMPIGLSSALFKWFYYEEEYDMKFIAGFMGVEQIPETLALRPAIGWAVSDTNIVPSCVVQTTLGIKMNDFNFARNDKLGLLTQEMHDDMFIDKKSKEYLAFREKMLIEKKQFFIGFEDGGLTEEMINRPEDEEHFDEWLKLKKQEFEKLPCRPESN